MTAATTTRDPFAALDQFGAETDEMVQRFAAVATPAPVVRCLGGCGRRLTSATSIRRGYGRQCWKRAHERAATLGPEYSDTQVESALEALEDGAVVPAAVPGVWYVVGSRGDAIYETTLATCTCERFGKRGKACSHMAAVSLVVLR